MIKPVPLDGWLSWNLPISMFLHKLKLYTKKENAMSGINSSQQLQNILTKRREEKEKQAQRNEKFASSVQTVVSAAEDKRDQAHRSATVIIEDTFNNLGPNALIAKQEKVFEQFISEIRHALVDLLNQQYKFSNVVEMYSSWSLNMSDMNIGFQEYTINTPDIARRMEQEKQRWLKELDKRHQYVRQALSESSTHQAVGQIYAFASQEISFKEFKQLEPSIKSSSPYNIFKNWEWSDYTYQKTQAPRMLEELNATIASAPKGSSPSL